MMSFAGDNPCQKSDSEDFVPIRLPSGELNCNHPQVNCLQDINEPVDDNVIKPKITIDGPLDCNHPQVVCAPDYGEVEAGIDISQVILPPSELDCSNPRVNCNPTVVVQNECEAEGIDKVSEKPKLPDYIRCPLNLDGDPECKDEENDKNESEFCTINRFGKETCLPINGIGGSTSAIGKQCIYSPNGKKICLPSYTEFSPDNGTSGDYCKNGIISGGRCIDEDFLKNRFNSLNFDR